MFDAHVFFPKKSTFLSNFFVKKKQVITDCNEMLRYVGICFMCNPLEEIIDCFYCKLFLVSTIKGQSIERAAAGEPSLYEYNKKKKGFINEIY